MNKLLYSIILKPTGLSCTLMCYFVTLCALVIWKILGHLLINVDLPNGGTFYDILSKISLISLILKYLDIIKLTVVDTLVFQNPNFPLKTRILPPAINAASFP